MLIQSFGKGYMFENLLLSFIAEDIKSATDNGYSFDEYSDEDLAGELIAYADYDNYSFDEILEAVKEYRKNK